MTTQQNERAAGIEAQAVPEHQFEECETDFGLRKVCTVIATLPCGCILTHSCATKLETPIADLAVFRVNARKLLLRWLQVRSYDHECALVSEQNPTGSRETAKSKFAAGVVHQRSAVDLRPSGVPT